MSRVTAQNQEAKRTAAYLLIVQAKLEIEKATPSGGASSSTFYAACRYKVARHLASLAVRELHISEE